MKQKSGGSPLMHAIIFRMTGPHVPQLLDRWNVGDELVSLSCGEFRELAQARMRREWPNRMLSTTGLVHSAFVQHRRSLVES